MLTIQEKKYEWLNVPRGNMQKKADKDCWNDLGTVFYDAVE